MKTHILRVGECNVSGDLGLYPAGMSQVGEYEDIQGNFSGISLAHDLIEHVNGVERIGSVEDELEALGAMYWIRGLNGALNRDNPYNRWTPEQNIGFDIARMMELDPLRQSPSTKAGDYDDYFDEIFDFAYKNFDGTNFDEEPGEDWKRVWLLSARHFFRVGFRKARKRFPDKNWAEHVFYNVAKAVEACIKEIDFEGQEFKLRYSLTSGEAWCEEHYDDYDDYE